MKEACTDPADECEAAWAGNSVVPISYHGVEEGKACGLQMGASPCLRTPGTMADTVPITYATLGPVDLWEVLPKAKSFGHRPLNNRAGRDLIDHLRPTP